MAEESVSTSTFGDLVSELQALHRDLFQFTTIVNNMRKMAADTFTDCGRVLDMMENTKLVRQLPHRDLIRDSALQLRALMAVNVMYFHRHYHPAIDAEQGAIRAVRVLMGDGEADVFKEIVDQLLAEMALEVLENGSAGDGT